MIELGDVLNILAWSAIACIVKLTIHIMDVRTHCTERVKFGTLSHGMNSVKILGASFVTFVSWQQLWQVLRIIPLLHLNYVCDSVGSMPLL